MISQAIRQIREATNFDTLDESATKEGVVLRLLSAAGWDTFDVSQVVPEYTVGNRRVDYALSPGTANAVFIEVKRPGENLERHQQQLLEYCFQEGVKLAVLTNGKMWWLYLPLQAGSWEQRRFLTIDLAAQEPDVVEHSFLEFLSPNKVVSGQAVRAAEALVESRRRAKVTGEGMIAAWQQLVERPDELLVDLIAEATERICGFLPEPELVERFLAQFIQGEGDPSIGPGKLSDPFSGAMTGPMPVTNRQTTRGRRDGSLPITLEPLEIEEFHAALLEAGEAWLEISYDDGRKEVRRWDASRMSQSSNVMGNLRSRPEFRAGAWRARGIASLRVTIEYPGAP